MTKPSFEIVYDERKEAARAILTAENAVLDARTAKLKALRQARDEADDALQSAARETELAAAAQKRAAKKSVKPVRLKKTAASKSLEKPLGKSPGANASRGPTHSQLKAWARIDKG